MGEERKEQRIDRASRVILASARTLYRAFLDAETMAGWRAPEAMDAEIRDFRPQVGGGYRMRLRYHGEDAANQGKTLPGEDEVEVVFAEMIAEERVVEKVRFLSDDPMFGGVMTLITSFEKDRDGTKVIVCAHDVPQGITPHDHAQGMASSLRNLARLTE
ncbi:SRPBCC domain-containing protein [Sphingomonas sp. VDB2]|uniref:SRPBCC domain-containing protein n=1 Tax=Sphingomonas sp. VDB2 TaxID=3228751 RepID=UPI003A80771B